MTDSPTPRHTAELDSPEARAQIRAEYRAAERLRATVLAVSFLAVATLFFARWGFVEASGLTPIGPRRVALSIGAATFLALAGVQVLLRLSAHRLDRPRSRRVVLYGSTVLEVGVITAAWLAVGSFVSPLILDYPRALGLSVLVVLSALRLDWRLTAATAALAAMANGGLHLYQVDAGLEPRSGPSSSVATLLVIGATSALVAHQARRRMLNAVHALLVRRQVERALTRATEEARQRIGRDLHDGLGGHLWGVALMAEAMARRAERLEPLEPSELRDLANLVREGVDQTRVLARGLTPAPLADGLAAALEALAGRTNAAGVTCAFDLRGRPLECDADVARNLHHIAQEAVANAVRHGRPSRVDIRLTVRPNTLALDVRDDGAGIPRSAPEGLGMRTMRQRAELLGAVLRVRSSAEGGTAVSCVLPIDGR